LHLRRATGEVKRRHARERAAWIQLRNLVAVADADVVVSTEGCIAGTALGEVPDEPPES